MQLTAALVSNALNVLLHATNSDFKLKIKSEAYFKSEALQIWMSVCWQLCIDFCTLGDKIVNGVEEGQWAGCSI